MDEKRKVSIVVPAYNAQNFISETVASVLSQTYQNFELILVNDGSTDKTLEMLTSLADSDTRIRVFTILNGGAAAARNYGVNQALGRYLAFLDADDLWRADKLEKEIEFLEEKKATFVFTGYEFADEAGTGTGKIVEVPPQITYKQALQNTTIFTSTVLFDLQYFSKEDLQMPKIKSEDTALWWKILRTGTIAYGLNENLVKYRRAGNTLSSNKLEAIRRIWNLYRKSEQLSVCRSAYNFFFWAVRAVKRRV